MPTGSIACDGVIIGVMIISFGSDVVNMVAAANVAYVVVFILLPVSYLRLRERRPETVGAFRIGRSARPLAYTLAMLNSLLLLFGGLQWGLEIMLAGSALTLAIVPISYASRRSWPDKRLPAARDDGMPPPRAGTLPQVP